MLNKLSACRKPTATLNEKCTKTNLNATNVGRVAARFKINGLLRAYLNHEILKRTDSLCCIPL